MKREIKFRGIHISSGSPVYGNLIHKIINGKYYFEIERSDNQDYQNWEVDPKTIDQFTGLKDSRGVDIYESDQLYIAAGYSSKVEFIDGCFMSVYDHPEDPETIELYNVIGKDTVVI